MRLSNFSATVVGGNEKANGYVEMKHNTVYQLLLQNEGRNIADARVEIDGKHIGTWRVPAYGSIRLERPVNETGKFTFYQLGTTEANLAGLQRNEMLGLIAITFMPEKSYTYPPMPSRAETTSAKSAPFPACAPGAQSYNAGGTGLSGQSSQQFTNVAKLDYDESAFVTINLRLVGIEDVGIRPLKPLSTPIPPSLI